MFHRLLICTDLSDGLQRFVHFVPSLAAGGVRQIVFLHTLAISSDWGVPQVDETRTQQIRDRLAVAQQQAPDGVEVSIEVQWGKPVEHILSAVQSYRPDLILLSANSRSLLTEKLFGSTTMQLCQRVQQVPLLIFRPQLISTYTREELDLRCRHLFRSWLVPYDGSEIAQGLVQQIQKQAQHRTPEFLEQCLLCWVVDEGGRIPKAARLQDADARIAAAQVELEAAQLQVNTVVLQGEPVVELLAVAQEQDVSVIALASDSLGKLLELSVPSVAGEILRRSWHPVIYFPLGDRF